MNEIIWLFVVSFIVFLINAAMLICELRKMANAVEEIRDIFKLDKKKITIIDLCKEREK